MKILITGSHGLIGSALKTKLLEAGHELVCLVRQTPEAGSNEVQWDPELAILETGAFEGIEAVVHLAGENIAAGRWSQARKRRIRNSRVMGTRLLSAALAEMKRPPQVFVMASAIGYYGDRGEAQVDEASPAGSGFLAELCRDWEAASQSAEQAGIRVVRLRIGVVLSAAGGALSKMLPAFRMGVAGTIGNGRQYMSWIALDDVVGIIMHSINNKQLSGAVNLVAPHFVSNREFTKSLGRVLSRPTFFSMPAFVAELAFGEMADELLLASTRVKPSRLLASGYQFQYPELEPALRHVLHK